MKIKHSLIPFAAIALMTASFALPVFAADKNATSTAEKKAAAVEKHMDNMQDRGTTEIDNRIGKITQISSRIGQMTRVSDSDRASLSTSLQSEIDLLNTLKAKISADNSTSTLKADVSSITGAYRIYALVLPKTLIVAESDRILTIADMMNTLTAKLKAQATSSPTTDPAVQAAFTDISVKTTDAMTNAQAAISAVVPLVPDQGDKTKLAANTAALKSARAKVKTGEADLKAARTDLQTIMNAYGLK